MTKLTILLKNPVEFSKILKYCLTFEPTCRIICEESGIHIQSMDAGHTAIVDIKLPPEYFTEYKCDKIYDIGILIESLFNIVKNVKNETLLITSVDGSILDVNINGEDGFEVIHTVKTINIDTDVMNIPDMTPNYLAEIPVATVKKWKKHVHDYKKAPTTFAPGKDKAGNESKLSFKISSEDDKGTTSLFETVHNLEYDEPSALQISSGNMEKCYSLLVFNYPIVLKFVNGAPLECRIQLADSIFIQSYFAPMFTDEELEDHGTSPKKRKTSD
jgi:hypothetical protein